MNNLWNEIVVGELFGLIGQGIDQIPVPWVAGFLGSGVLEGISAVLSFLPWILVLFLFFSILEDSGYMARVAFILDRIFRKFGLSRQSVHAHDHGLRLLGARHHQHEDACR